MTLSAPPSSTTTPTAKPSEWQGLRPARLVFPQGAGRLRRCGLLLLFGLQVLAALWLAAAVLSTHCDQQTFGWLSFLGLSFPLALASVLSLGLIAALVARRQLWLPLLALLLHSSAIWSYAPLNLTSQAPAQRANSIRLLSYNVHYFDASRSPQVSLPEFGRYFLRSEADLIALQEGCPGDWEVHQILPIMERQHHYHWAQHRYGDLTLILFSRFPIEESRFVSQLDGNGAVLYRLRLPTGERLHLINAHLKSNVLSAEERAQFSHTLGGEAADEMAAPSFWTKARNMAQKISQAARGRDKMACDIRLALDSLRQHHGGELPPTLVCGDFNETPISRPTRLMEQAGLQDLFRLSGTGLSRSYRKDRIVVRIDQAFASPQFVPLFAQIDRSTLLSDHWPLMVDVQLRKPEQP